MNYISRCFSGSKSLWLPLTWSGGSRIENIIQIILINIKRLNSNVNKINSHFKFEFTSTINKLFKIVRIKYSNNIQINSCNNFK